MTKITLQDVSSFTNEASALVTVNSNSNVIEIASDNFLSRDGTTPNQMGADLDLNSNHLLNIGDPLNMGGGRIIGLEDGIDLDEPVTVNQLNQVILTGGGAPGTLPFITVSNTGGLSAERALAVGTGLTLTDGGANSTITVAEDITSGRNKLHPTSSTDNAVTRFDGTTGDLQNSGVLISDTNNITGVGTLATSGNITMSGTSLVLNGAGSVGIELGRVDGTSSTPFIDFHSGSTAVDYDTRLISGNPTGVAGGGQLQLDGASIRPTSNDQASLGVSTTSWSDLFLADGGVINWNNGNNTLTHSSGNLTNSGNFITTGNSTTTGSLFADGSVAFRGDISPTTISADQNDYNPTGLSTASTIRLTATGTFNITGLAGGADGRIIILHNVDTADALILIDESASSTAANRFALTANLTLTPDTVVMLQYDSTLSRWRSIGGTGGGGGGAATTEPFVTIGNTAGLSAERALTAGTGITLTDGGANGNATIASVGSLLRSTLFTSNGTWTKGSNCRFILAIAVGGGGGGGTSTGSLGASGGGGGGGGAMSVIDVTAVSTYGIVIGAGGAANSAGGNTTINTTTVVANGGAGSSNGGNDNPSDGGAGGTAGTGNITFRGEPGGNGLSGLTGGHGGTSFFGGSGKGTAVTTSTAGGNYGGGGGGGAGGAGGSAGFAGVVWILEFA